MNLYGIVVAAGRGERFGRPKADVALGGIALWERARDAIAGVVESVVVVGDVPGGIAGGERRRDSVLKGLAALPRDATHALIHDAARPLATPALAAAVVERLARGDAEAVVPVVPVRDTVKRVGEGWVEDSVDRGGLAASQTPQGVVIAALRRALETDDSDASDDAVAIERAGGRVATVAGEPANLKITFLEDLTIAEALLR